jgi:ATPase, P-type (transporting), HAD superfamily, subfamily IC/ATPase, P-type (transporting), HAD superfamily, subfamily IC
MAAAASIARLSITEVYGALGSGHRGLTTAEAALRQTRFGRNALPHVAGRPLLARLAANFTHLMALLLWTGGLIGFVAGMPQLGLAIWLVNVINGAFSFWQEYRAERATEALSRLLPAQVRVLRDGVEQRAGAEEVVPGDVLILAEGDHVPADARLVEEAELRVDQSTLTGESDAVRKTADPVLDPNLAETDLRDLVFAGTSVAAGTGRAVVFAIGAATGFGRIAFLTQTVREEPSPLQKELGQATRIVSVLALGIGAIFFALSVVFAHIGAAESFIFAMGMVVAFVPEGMLPLVTLALAMATQRMARRNALVKRLSAVETLGCTTVICTDKTGTLTQNEMTVRRIWLPDAWFEVSGVGYGPDGKIVPEEDGGRGIAGQELNGRARRELQELLRAATLCNDARLVPPDASASEGRWTALGDPTEAALLVAACKAGLNPDAEARALPRLRELPFDSRRKRMSTLHSARREPGAALAERLPPESSIARQRVVAYVKGAPGEVLARCSRIRSGGSDGVIDDAARAAAIAANDLYASSGLRVLAIARRELDVAAGDATPEIVESDLTLLGLVAMHDPPRPEVASAVDTCHRAGIRVVLITGDYGLTAESIARRIGIVRGDVRLVNGNELDAMSDDALREALADQVVFARVSPEHKLRVVTAFQSLGHVVAVTGDGVNDAPALKKADIGVAMGLAGTDVAKESADIILTDDNFASIVSAVEEGRGVYAAIKKFVGYIFTSNTPEAWPFILFAFSGGRIPVALPVMQVLAIDLGTDMAPALALGAEPPEPGIMDRPPRSLRDHVITGGLLIRSLLYLGTIQSLAAMAAFYFLFWTSGYAGQWLDLPSSGPVYQAATAMALASVVMTQVGNLFAHRTERISVLRLGRRRLFGNRLIWLGITVELVLILLLVYSPVANGVFGTAAFAPGYWTFLVAWIPVLFVADELRKAVVRRRERPGAPRPSTGAPFIHTLRPGGNGR